MHQIARAENKQFCIQTWSSSGHFILEFVFATTKKVTFWKQHNSVKVAREKEGGQAFYLESNGNVCASKPPLYPLFFPQVKTHGVTICRASREAQRESQ